MGWIGVDLDGTLAEYHGWQGAQHIGAPIPKMVERVKNWIADGKDVRIFTARVAPQSIEAGAETYEEVLVPIAHWCLEHLGRVLTVTHEKDLGMIELWDDRCVQVLTNNGATAAELNAELAAKITFLLRTYGLYGPEGFTFPDGDTWVPTP